MPTFSHSRLNAYENCPMQYRLRYVDKVDVPRRESIEAFLGKRVSWECNGKPCNPPNVKPSDGANNLGGINAH